MKDGKEKQENKEEIKKEDNTKKYIITLIIGIIVGSLLTCLIFHIARPKNPRRIPDFSQIEKSGRRIAPDNGNFNSRKKDKDKIESEKSLDNSKTDDNSKTENSIEKKS